jgi:hypothetical protein
VHRTRLGLHILVYIYRVVILFEERDYYWTKCPSSEFFRFSILGSLIKFKNILVLHLIVLEKDNIIYILLVNVMMCLKLIWKPNILCT